MRILIVLLTLLVLACAPEPASEPVGATVAPLSACEPPPTEDDSQAWVDAMLARVGCEIDAGDPWEYVDHAQDPTLSCRWSCQVRACVTDVLVREAVGLLRCEEQRAGGVIP